MHTVAIHGTHRLLRRLGLHLANLPRHRQVAHQHKEHILGMFKLENARRFNKHGILVLAHRPADFHNRDIRAGFLLRTLEAAGYLLANVGHRVNAFPPVAQRAFFVYDVLVHHATGHVVLRRERRVQKALIVAHILVALQT